MINVAYPIVIHVIAPFFGFWYTSYLCCTWHWHSFLPILRHLTKRIPITKTKGISLLFFKIYQWSDLPEREIIIIALTGPGPWGIWIWEVMFPLPARWAYSAFIALSCFLFCPICLWKKKIVCHTCGITSLWNRRLHHPIFLAGSGIGTCLPFSPTLHHIMYTQELKTYLENPKEAVVRLTVSSTVTLLLAHSQPLIKFSFFNSRIFFWFQSKIYLCWKKYEKRSKHKIRITPTSRGNYVF